jgi:asparagine synthase (glutamine-hydrolysing)
MSAIWGVVDFQKDFLNKNLVESMERPYHNYKIDQFKHRLANNVLFGYGGQYFTREAIEERQPIVNKAETKFFVADAVLDNREELFEFLGTAKEKQQKIPDGTLMYQLMCKFGKQSVHRFLGTYAFAYYDKKKEEVLLVSDAVGSRCLYYTYIDGKLYFSTLIKSILEVMEHKPDWNYRFLSDYLTINNLSLYTEAEETPYRNIYKVAPGYMVIINSHGIRKEEYWKLPAKKRAKKKKDEEWKAELIGLFDQCVTSVMRSAGKTGILLSGGLDSTSVACFAAPKLSNLGEKLYSYTSVPEEDYKSKEASCYYTNEKKMVELTKAFLGNTESSFLDLPGMNAFDDSEEYLKEYELPFKSLQNIRWIHEGVKKAAEDGCRMVLTGQLGNSTISFGDFEIYLNTLLFSGHLFKLFQEVNALHRERHYGRKKLYKKLMITLFDSLFRKKIKLVNEWSEVYVNPELIKQYNSKRGYLINKVKNPSTYTSHQLMLDSMNKMTMIQIGEFETHLSLITGVLLRDPTKDRRLIEFCLKLPANQFVHRGVERRLVREYMKDYLPAEILTERHKGIQSADLVHRLNKNWAEIYKECSSILEEGNTDYAGKLLELPKIKKKLEAYKDSLSEAEINNKFEIYKLLYSVLLVKYVTVMQ